VPGAFFVLNDEFACHGRALHDCATSIKAEIAAVVSMWSVALTKRASMTATMVQTDEQLKAWSLGVVPEATVTFHAPAALDPGAGSQVSLYLLGLAPLPSTHGKPPSPFQLSLHYLVTVSDTDPVKAHHTLARLVFAAMENPDLELDLTALPPAMWSALGVVPQPCLVLRLPLRQARPELPVRIVEHLPVIRSTPMAGTPAAST
jgi:hypothetical protein